MNNDTPSIQSPPVPAGTTSQVVGSEAEAHPGGSPVQSSPLSVDSDWTKIPQVDLSVADVHAEAAESAPSQSAGGQQLPADSHVDLPLEPGNAAPQPFSLSAFRTLCFDHQVKEVIDSGLRLLLTIERCSCNSALDNPENAASVLDELRAEATRASQIDLAVAGWWLGEAPTWDSSASSFLEALCGLARQIVFLAAIATGELRENLAESDADYELARICDAEYFAGDSVLFRRIVAAHWQQVRAAIRSFSLPREWDHSRSERFPAGGECYAAWKSSKGICSSHDVGPCGVGNPR